MKHIYRLLFLFTLPLFGQVSEHSELFIQLKKMDSLVFEEGFNHCDLALLETIVTDDLEFYHDTGGFQDKQQFIEATKTNICGNLNKKISRKLMEGSLTVFPLHNNGVLYGALQNGEHLFYIKEPNKEKYLTGYAKFTSLWILKSGKWKLKRVFSFDHQAR